ncbi:hypothetical protein Acr_23g0013270 [Actinidia rufa]|uniref:Uncharacterized protein n=1 Tax=Actinidia rufa TaxID=165716 RepID=A0A7J0GQ73_9ERIC|nr:hypothetical protein Acr_23g0013270 [Actinidia rufa]
MHLRVNSVQSPSTATSRQTTNNRTFPIILRRLHGRASARAPAVQVHDPPERLFSLFPSLVSVSPPHRQIGPNHGGKRAEISRISASSGGREPSLAMVKRFDGGLQFVALIGLSVHDGDTRRHPNSIQMSHSCVLKL